MAIKYITKDGVQESKTIQTPEQINTIAADSNNSYIWAMSNLNLYRIDVSSFPAVVSAPLKFNKWSGVSDGVEHKFIASFIDGDRNLWAIEGRDLYCYNLINFDNDILTNMVLPASLKTITVGTQNSYARVLTITKSRTAIVGVSADPIIPTSSMVKLVEINSSGNLNIVSTMANSINGACEDDDGYIWASVGGYLKKYNPVSWTEMGSYNIGGELWAVGFNDGFVFAYRKDNGTIYKYTKSGTASGSIAGNGNSNFTNSDFTGNIKKNITGGYYAVDSVSVSAMVGLDEHSNSQSGQIITESGCVSNSVKYFIESDGLCRLLNISGFPIYKNELDESSQDIFPTGLETELYLAPFYVNRAKKYTTSVKNNNIIVNSEIFRYRRLSGIVAQYPLLSDANDVSGNGYHGTTTATFDGTAMYVSSDAHAILLNSQIASILNASQAATICFWVKEVSNNGGAMFGFQNIGTIDGSCHWPYDDGMFYTSAFRNARVDSMPTLGTTTRRGWVFYAISTGPIGWFAYRIGCVFGNAEFHALNINPSTMWIGRGSYGYKNCYIRDFSIYNRQLYLQELKTIESWG